MPAVKNHRTPAHAKERRTIAPAAQAARGVPPSRGRPSWSGLLRLSLVSVPVKAYPAVTSTATSPFHLLHVSCGQRIRYAKHCPQHGTVESDAIVRGYEYAPDQFVVIEAEELNRLRPVKDRALILEQFLPVQEVAPTFFAGRSLYLYSDGPAAQHPYNVLVEALHQAGQGARSGGPIQPTPAGAGAIQQPLAGPGCAALSQPGSQCGLLGSRSAEKRCHGQRTPTGRAVDCLG
jgi:hypothetical protein